MAEKHVFKPQLSPGQKRCRHHDWQPYTNPNIRKFHPQADPDQPMRRCRKCGAIEAHLKSREERLQ